MYKDKVGSDLDSDHVVQSGGSSSTDSASDPSDHDDGSKGGGSSKGVSDRNRGDVSNGGEVVKVVEVQM